MPSMLKTLAALAALLASLSSHAQVEVTSERITERNGLYTVCGNGEGMQPCRDRAGETYEEEMHGPDIQAEGSEELAEQAERIRNESPEELEATITEMELGHEPDGY